MYEDLKVFIKDLIKKDCRFRYCIVSSIDIKVDGEWYDFVAYFTKSGHSLTAGSIKISDCNKQIRRKKLEKLKI
jgi:hypothetical protein